MPATSVRKSRAPEFGLIVIAAGIVALLLFTGNMTRVIELLFNRTTLVVAVVMLVEYVIIKGFDRSAQYRRQLESSQNRRRDDLLTLQRVEQKLSELEARLSRAVEADPAVASNASDLRDQIVKIREDIKSRG